MIILVLVSLLLNFVDPARILGIYPIPSVSHQAVFDAYNFELAKQGHDLVIITTNPRAIEDKFKDKITVIDISPLFQNLAAKRGPQFQNSARGVIANFDVIDEYEIYHGVVIMLAEMFDIPQVKELIEDPNQHFDLIIVEGIFYYHLIPSHIFKAPVIAFSTMYGVAEYFEALGGTGRHPVFYPHYHRSNLGDNSFWGKLNAIYSEYKIYNYYNSLERFENELLKEKFGPNAPTVDDLKKNIKLMFVNAHKIFGNNRPLPPNVVYLGGAIHLQPVKNLTEDLRSFLDNSKRGVVYVSLGSNTRPSSMFKEFKNVFLKAFEALPYDVIFKYDGDDLVNVPKNVKVGKWYPQRDLLMHPNVKAFVTQGGVQSTDEAIDAGVPLVGIPMAGDQWFNTFKYVELGIGVQLDSYTATTDDIVKGVLTVINDQSYRRNIKELKAAMKDQPQSSMELAIWWTEYLLRHGDKYIKSPAAHVSLWEYYMVDVFLIAVAYIVLALTVLVLLAYALFRFIVTNISGKYKIKKN